MLGIDHAMVGTGERKRPPVPNAPEVEVLLGASEDSAVGVLHVTVAPGAAMPEHDHGPSTTTLMPVAGSARLIDVDAGGQIIDLAPGMVTTIPVGRRVRLENAGDVEARLMVVVAPADFARNVARWPAA
jgi:quercetin dioxygenase-like cupin family protein